MIKTKPPKPLRLEPIPTASITYVIWCNLNTRRLDNLNRVTGPAKQT